MPASPTRTIRTTAAAAILVFGSLLSSGRMIFRTPRPGHFDQDSIASRSDQRFAVLKTRLPAEGVVGYVGESSDSATPNYYLTQYALAPLIVDNSTDHPIVIGNFPSSHASGVPRNLKLVDDLGNGVLLLANKDAK
jgi:hypothetical protein